MPKNITINLKTSLQGENAKILKKLLEENPSKELVGKTNYTVRLPDPNNLEKTAEYNVMLSHSIMTRKSKSKPEEYRYEVFDRSNLVGSGGMGNVYESLGTLVPQVNGSLRFKNNKPRVIKEQSHRPEKNPLEMLVNEIEASKQLNHLRIKDPMIIENPDKSHTSLTVMKYIQGEDLSDILKSDRQKSTSFSRKEAFVLSIIERLELSVRLLRAYQEQVQIYKLVHRDLKPRNIRIDMSNGKVYIIDYGLSKNIGEISKDIQGTFAYLPPEALDTPCKLTEKYDIPALGRIISEIWRAEEGKDLILESLEEVKQHAENPELKDLFEGIEDMEPFEKEGIRKLIFFMIDKNINSRNNLEKSLYEWDEMLLNFKLKNEESSEIKNQIYEAHHVSNETRFKLMEQSMKESKDVFSDINAILTHALKQVIDTPDVIEEFISTLDVAAFQGLKTKNAILDKLDDLFSADLKANVNELHGLRLRINGYQELFEHINNPEFNRLKTELSNLYNDVEYFLAKNNKSCVTIDQIEQVNIRLKEGVQKINFNLSQFEKLFNPNLKQENKEKRNPNFNELIEITDYLSKITLPEKSEKEEDKELTDLQKHLKEIIKSNLVLLLNKNKFTKDASSFQEKLIDIKELLSIVKEAKEVGKLKRDITKKLTSIKVGPFSKTKLKLKEEIKECLKDPSKVFKFEYKSK